MLSDVRHHGSASTILYSERAFEVVAGQSSSIGTRDRFFHHREHRAHGGKDKRTNSVLSVFSVVNYSVFVGSHEFLDLRSL